MKNLALCLALLPLGCGDTAPPSATPPAADATTGAEAPDASAPPLPAFDNSAYASVEDALKAASEGSHRSDKNIARNGSRHPVQTLAFFGLKRDMRVIELWPGGGWYTEVLAPVLKDSGTLVLANMDPEGKRGRGARNLLARLGKAPQVYGTPATAVLDPPDALSLGEAGSADMVVTFRSSHNWQGRGALESVFKASFAVLKSGGVFGVVQHRAAEGASPDSAKQGYVAQAHLVAVAEAAGFKLDESSEVNANPKDTRDHPKGVWTLPPSLSLGDADRDKYLAIGESDRMTLRFVKP